MLRDAIRGNLPKLPRDGAVGPTDDQISILDTKPVQLAGGSLSAVPGAFVPGGAPGTDLLMESGLMPKPSQYFRLGKGGTEVVLGIGQMGVGVSMAVGGGGASVTGGGALVGIPVCVAGVALAVNGAVTFLNGAKTVIVAICEADDAPVMGPQPLAATAANGPSSSPAPPPSQPAQASPPPQQAAPPPAAKPPPNPVKKAGKPKASSAGQTQAIKKPCRYLTTQTGTSTGTHTNTWTKCTGQMHHGITKQIHRELQKHKTLANVYKYRDNRFVSQAINEKAHKGWPDWHRDMEKKVVKWLEDHDTATPAQFEAYLTDLYKHDNTLNWRFPNGM